MGNLLIGVVLLLVSGFPCSADDKGKWYVTDNYVEGFSEVSADNWQGVDGSNYIKMNAPWDAMPINQQSAPDAYIAVLEKAGWSFPKWDAVAVRIIHEVRTGKATMDNKGIIKKTEEVGGWPELKSKRAPKDSDGDGMPDKWEKTNGCNPKDPSDRNNVGGEWIHHFGINITGAIEGNIEKMNNKRVKL